MSQGAETHLQVSKAVRQAEERTQSLKATPPQSALSLTPKAHPANGKPHSRPSCPSFHPSLPPLYLFLSVSASPTPPVTHSTSTTPTSPTNPVTHTAARLATGTGALMSLSGTPAASSILVSIRILTPGSIGLTRTVSTSSCSCRSSPSTAGCGAAARRAATAVGTSTSARLASDAYRRLWVPALWSARHL